MHSQTIARALAPAAAIVAIGVALLLLRAPGDELPMSFAQPAPPVEERAAPPRAEVKPAAASSDAPALAKARELEAMSETFRNTTFLIAIRDAGFVCYELLRVYGGVDSSAKWMATCSEMLAYTVSVGSTGELQVAPMLQYFDGVTPQIIQQDRVPSSVPEPRLDPLPRPPQRQR
jgi:hypothetical protein